jgi:predicted GH43/DUF377 family glycosyl hydrolase
MTTMHRNIYQCPRAILFRTALTIATFAVLLCAVFATAQAPSSSVYKPWMISPFTQVDAVNPILGPNFDTLFFDPIRKQDVRWEARAIIGAAAVVKDGKLALIYHAEDSTNGFKGDRGTWGTFRQGLAWSTDGLHFKRESQPVLYPDNGPMKDAEWTGGDEIPRIVEGPDKTYYLYYSSWNRTVTRLSVATSKDLVHWTKQGLIFGKAYSGKYQKLWCKAGAVVTELKDDRLVAAKIKGKYWMYFGEGEMHIATSDNLVDWTPLELAAGQKNTPAAGETTYNHDQDSADLLIVQFPRKNKFDSDLVEGGVAVLTKNGIVHIYNASDKDSPESATWKKDSALYYSLGQALMSSDDPTKLLDRSDVSFLKPDRDFEQLGATPDVVYLTGIAWFHGKWMLYYNGADWMVGVAATP